MRCVIVFISILLILPTIACSQTNQPSTSNAIDSLLAKDATIFNAIINKAKAEKWHEQPVAETMVNVATAFLGTPYIGATLEAEGPEHLVVNLRELDCTTFAETVLAIANCIKADKTTFDEFKQSLTRIRYRNGIIDQYPSRLHYFTDWMIDNQRKGIIEIASEQLGTQTFDASVGFMSANPDKYKALHEHPEFVPVIAAQEAIINKTQLKYVPKQEVVTVEQDIRDGDIIAIATTIDGLDIAHVGIAYHYNGRLHMIHASTSEKKVVMTSVPLTDYLAGIKRHTGILVARPIGR